jgi:hypothetical protein
MSRICSKPGSVMVVWMKKGAEADMLGVLWTRIYELAMYCGGRDQS